MEIKIISAEEFLEMFPNINIDVKEFLRTAKETKIVRLKGTKKFRPIYQNYIGSFYLVKNREVYLKP